MKNTINKFFGFDKNSLFHIFIHAGFVVSILAGLITLWIAYFANL